MGFLNPSSWTDPFEDIIDIGEDVIDAARDVAEQAVGVAEVVGEGIVDGATMIGEGVVTAGTGVAKWSVNAAGDAVEWSKTSFAEVAAWTESAAGLVAGFSVDAYRFAYDAVKVVYQFLADYFTETLPKLGGIDANARTAAEHLLTTPVARGIEALADVAGCVITLGIKLKAVGSVSIGLYACGDGWGFFLDSSFTDLGKLTQNPQLSLGVSAQATMVFGPVSRASGAKAIKLGLGIKTNPAKKLAASIGGVVLMEATTPPLFLGLRYAMELDVALFGKKTVDDAGKLKWKVKTALPKPNGEFVTDAYGVVGDVVEVGWEDLTTGLASQASHFDAALRAHADPAGADRLVATALAASLSPFKPRYHGEVRTGKGQAVVGTGQGALGLDLAGDRRVVQVVSGLTDPTAVSLEVVGEPPLYWCVQAEGGVKLVAYDKALDLSGTTFRMLRGLTDQGVSFCVAKDGTNNPRFLVATRVRGGIVTPTPVLCAERMIGIEAPAKADAVFLLDRPVDQTEAAGSVIRAGGWLAMQQPKRAPNGMFALMLGADGRLVVHPRGSGSMNAPTAWLPYMPGVIQDAVVLWAWASPVVAAAPAYHAVVTADGRLAVRVGADPAHAGATLWQTEVRGTPGACFLAVTNQGVITLMRGTPEAPGELVWTSVTGAIDWPTRRRQVVLRVGSKYVRADQGGGVHKPESLTQEAARSVRADATLVGGWEAFELQDLCTGAFALRAQGRRFVGVADGGAVLCCLRDQVTARERFALEVVGGGGEAPQQVRLKSLATGAYVGVMPDGTIAAIGAATTFELIEVEHDLTAHSGRPVHVIAKHSGRALEVPDGRVDNGVGLVQGRFSASDHQKWTLTYVGDGWFTLVNRQTGKAIDIGGGSQVAGAAALQWPLHGGANQKFRLTPTGDGHYFIQASHSGQVLDVEAGSTASGARVLQWPPHGGPNQRWRVTLASAAVKPADAFTQVRIKDLAHLLSLETIKLRSWKGDRLSRPLAGQGVTSSAAGDAWRVGAAPGGKLLLRSWKDDFLHRPDSQYGVTTWSATGGSEWTLELAGDEIRLLSWKGDYLHRPDSPAGVTTWGPTVGSGWFVEARMP